MTTTHPDPRILATARLVENLARKLPIVREHIAAQLNAIGCLHGSTCDGSPGGERTIAVLITDDDGEPVLTADGRQQYDQVPVTAVEDYALQRVTLEHAKADLELDYRSIATVTARLLQDCDRILGTRLVHDVPRCDATGREGAIQWADATCTNVATRGPLCDRCSKREYRWRVRHELPPRRDGVFVGDLEVSA